MLHSDTGTYAMLARSARCRFWLAVLIGALLSLVLPRGAVLAAPAAPDEVQLVQPDGVVIVAVPFGDEWYSGYEYQGYTILRDARGYWVYAEPVTDGRLAPGPRRAGLDPMPENLAPSLRDRVAVAEAASRRTEALPLGSEAWPGSLGSGPVLIILMDFTPSTSLGTTDAQWNAAFFDNTAGIKSVKNYYEQASYGNFTMVPVPETYGTANDGVIDVTLPYANGYPWPDETERTSVRDTLIAADPYVDYAALDTDGNGSLDNTELHLVLIVRGYEESYGGTGGACTPNVWGHRWSMGTGSCAYCAPVLDGVTIGATAYNGGYTREGEWHEYISEGCTSSAGHRATIGIMVHELGHDITWPDLYDTDYTSAGVGRWCVMSGGSWGQAAGDPYSGVTPVLPTAYLKWYQHWLAPVEVTTPQSGVTVPNLAQNAVVYQVGANPGGVDGTRAANGTGEYFLVENRQQVGFDAGLYRISSSASGCLIWHIDETRANNTDETRKLVDVEEADGPPQDMDSPSGSGGNSGDSGDPWPGITGETVFSGNSDPNSNWYDGSASGIVVSGISTAGTGCTVSFAEVGPAWNGSVSSAWSNAGNWTTARVPNQADNTVIPSGVPNWPNVDAAASVFNLNILDGAHADAAAGVSLDVYGNWTEAGSGNFDASAGTVTFRGAFTQTIVTGAGSHFNDLQIGSGSTAQRVIAGSDLDVNGNLTIQSGARLAAGSHMLRVGGNWTDTPFGFAPGSSTVILDGAVQAVQKAASEVVVYSNDLSTTTGWQIVDANGNGTTWYYSTLTNGPNIPDHGQHARYQQPLAADDWLFSPGFSLQAGVAYTIRFNYSSMGTSWRERLAVHIGTAQTAGAMTTQVFDNNNVTNTTWQQGSGTFTPGTTGTYYVGFYCYSAASQYKLGVDDLVVAALDPDLAFYNLSVASAGMATLTDNTAVQNDLSVTAGGALALGTYDLTVEGNVTNNGSLAQTRTVNAASTPFLNVRNGAGTVDKYLGATIDPGSGNMGSTTVTIWGNQLCAGATVGVRRCFELDPATPQTAAVTFYYTEAERNGADNSTMQVYHWNGSDWELEGGTTTRGGSGDGQWVQVTSVDAYSPFALNNASPTAVALSRFDGQAMDDGSVLLEWETVSEVDLLGFHLYRAQSEAEPPVRLTEYMIPSQSPGSPIGGSYFYQDQTTVPGTTYYYWIDVIQLDGTPLRFGPVRVTAGSGGMYMIYLPLAMRGR